MFKHSLSSSEAVRCMKLIEDAGNLKSHLDFLRWTRADVQQVLPHDILLAAWGNFEDGSVQHDVLSDLEGVRSYAPGSDGLPFFLNEFHARWLAAGRTPLALDFREFQHLLGSTNLPGSFCAALGNMKSVLVHGLTDQRARHDCLYVFFSTSEQRPISGFTSVALLTPVIDASLRQIPHLPQQSPRQSQTVNRPVLEEGGGLSDRETQIMAWVAMGKTNSEIGCILNISGYTVKNHMQRIFMKLNVCNRTQAVSKVTRVSIDG